MSFLKNNLPLFTYEMWNNLIHYVIVPFYFVNAITFFLTAEHKVNNSYVYNVHNTYIKVGNRGT